MPPGRIYEKLRKQFQDRQSVPFILDKTRKQLFSNWEQKTLLKKMRRPKPGVSIFKRVYFQRFLQSLTSFMAAALVFLLAALALCF